MRFRTAVLLTTLFLVCFTVAAWSAPIPAETGTVPLDAVPDAQSVAGKISSIGDAAFAVDVMVKNQNVNTLQFLIDTNTKVEGKLSVGAQATVEYRFEAGKNIATHVVVTPASGTSQY
jgi:hypothetical protein